MTTGRTIRLAFGMSLLLTATLLTAGAMLSSTSPLPIEWAGAGKTEPVVSAPGLQLAASD